MNWIKINKDDLPTGEVLAGNFESRTPGYKHKLIGNLYLNGAGNVVCDSGDTLLNHCSHYVDINNYDPDDSLL